MSVVIIGGHDRMVSQYKKICKNYSTGINNFCPIEILCGFFRLFFC